MKKYVVFIFWILSTYPLLAASLIKGKIIDADTKTPIQYVDVALFKQGSKNLTSGAVTDSLGVFTIPLVEDGKYTLRITYIEYTTVVKTIIISGSDVDLGTISML